MIENPSRKLWFILLLLILVTPIGIWLPEKLHSKGAWGEWGTAELERLVGSPPRELMRLRELWNGVFPNYGLPQLSKPWQIQLGYLGAAFCGTAAIVLISFGLGRYWACDAETSTEDDDRPK